MASASVATVTTFKTVLLTLTDGEASFLRDILANIGGSSINTRRAFAETIADALDAVGIDRLGDDDFDPTCRGGSIYFKARPDIEQLLAA